ncbi:unnamed protein product [Prunus armeniaca]
MFPFCPFPFASLSIRTFRLLSAFQSVSNQLVGLVGGSHGRSEFTVLHAWGAVDFRLGRRAANPAALLVFILSVLLSDVVFVCCCSRCASSFFSSHGFSSKDFWFSREEDLRKKNWSNQYENPQSAHQSGN